MTHMRLKMREKYIEIRKDDIEIVLTSMGCCAGSLLPNPEIYIRPFSLIKLSKSKDR